MNYWLVKSEPDDCGIQHFVDKGSTAICWDGVRNYQARNFLRKMDTDDQCSCTTRVAKLLVLRGL